MPSGSQIDAAYESIGRPMARRPGLCSTPWPMRHGRDLPLGRREGSDRARGCGISRNWSSSTSGPSRRSGPAADGS